MGFMWIYLYFVDKKTEALKAARFFEMLRLDDLEKDEKDVKEESLEGSKETEDIGAEEDEDAYFEEEDFDDNDYNSNYFDPGEDYGDMDDGAEEGPVY